jgi:hypothetical protein
MSDRKINDLWMSGYCKDTVQTMNTIGTSHSRLAARMQYMKRHVVECERCAMANLAKGVEHDVAVELTKDGHPSALILFKSGMPSPVPYGSDEFGAALRKVLRDRGEGEKRAIEIMVFLANLKDGKEV